MPLEQGRDRRRGLRRGHIMAAAAAAGIAATALSVGPADAAPAGRPNTGVPFSSTVYGTGCTYPVTLAVDASGWVDFYEYKPGLPPRLVGRDLPTGTVASFTWVPTRVGNKYLYAVQNGKKSPLTFVAVRQGYGSAGLCFGI